MISQPNKMLDAVISEDSTAHSHCNDSENKSSSHQNVQVGNGGHEERPGCEPRLNDIVSEVDDTLGSKTLEYIRGLENRLMVLEGLNKNPDLSAKSSSDDLHHRHRPQRRRHHSLKYVDLSIGLPPPPTPGDGYGLPAPHPLTVDAPLKLITYKIDYLRVRNGNEEVFDSEAGEKPIPRIRQRTSPFSTNLTLPALEVVRRIKVSNPRLFTGLEKRQTILTINSFYLIEALEKVTDDPSALENLKSRDRVIILEPYQPVVYCLDGLRNYEINHPNEEDLDTTVSHINTLLEFIEVDIGEELEAERNLNSQKTPLVTWDWLWTVFRPGQTIISGGKKSRAYTLNTITGGNSDTPEGSSRYSPAQRPPPPLDCYTIICWALKFDGSHYKRESSRFSIPKFSGPKEITSLPVYPLAILEDRASRLQGLVRRGRRIYETHKASISHKEYNGWTLDPQPCEILGRVVIDHECFYQERAVKGNIDDDSASEDRFIYPTYPRVTSIHPHHSPNAYSDSDSEKDINYTRPATRYIGYTHNPPVKTYRTTKSLATLIPKNDILTETQIALLSNRVFGWILKDRRWAILDIDYVTDIVADKHIFESLILPEDRTEIIKGLVQSHKRREVTVPGQHQDQADIPYSADAIKGKGQGLLILLHGPPGVGKTSTAECVAEYTGRPLFPITCGDLGTRPKTLERNLQEAFRLAQRWGAVLLLDEADVFLGRRELDDINRNSLVSVFLRVLEYYTGILFLTTNRVGSFDEAFTSRLHVSIHYPRLEEKERSKIWKYHVQRVERIRDDLDVRDSVSDYLENNKELKKITFNGRQIRNIFQTAVSLALYEATIDQNKKGRPSLRSEHLKKVIKLSCEFQEYLKSTRDSDSANALDVGLRDDEFKGSRSKR